MKKLKSHLLKYEWVFLLYKNNIFLRFLKNRNLAVIFRQKDHTFWHMKYKVQVEL